MFVDRGWRRRDKPSDSGKNHCIEDTQHIEISKLILPSKLFSWFLYDENINEMDQRNTNTTFAYFEKYSQFL